MGDGSSQDIYGTPTFPNVVGVAGGGCGSGDSGERAGRRYRRGLPSEREPVEFYRDVAPNSVAR
jgi:hypothetical protein